MAVDIKVYSQSMWAPCEQAKEYLSRKGVAFTVKDIREDPAALQDLIALNVRSTPCVVIGGKVLVGFNPRAIDKALAETQPT